MVGAVQLLALLLLFLPQSMSSGALNTTDCRLKSCFVPGTCDEGKLEKLRLSKNPREDCPFGLIVEVRNSKTWNFLLYSTQSNSPMVLTWRDHVVNCSSTGAHTIGSYVMNVTFSNDGRECEIEVRNNDSNATMNEIFSNAKLKNAKLAIQVGANKKYLGDMKMIMEELEFRTPLKEDNSTHCQGSEVCFETCSSNRLVRQNEKSLCEAPFFSLNTAMNNKWKMTIIGSSPTIIERMEFKWIGETIFGCNVESQKEEISYIKNAIVISHIPWTSSQWIVFARHYATCTFTMISDDRNKSLMAWIVRNSTDTTEMQLVIHSYGIVEQVVTGKTDDLKRGIPFTREDRCDNCDLCEGERCVLGDGVIRGDGNCIQYMCNGSTEMIVNEKFFATNITCENSRWFREDDKILPTTVLSRIECWKKRDCAKLHPLASHCGKGEDNVCHTIKVELGKYDDLSCKNDFQLVYRTSEADLPLNSIACNATTGEWSVESSASTTIKFNDEITTIACLHRTHKSAPTEENNMESRDIIYPKEDETIGVTVGLYAAGIVVGIVLLLGLIACACVFITCKKLRPATLRSAQGGPQSSGSDASSKEKRDAAPTLG